MKAVLSPKELAEAIGLSESSLKRWADDGLIKVSRTAGGHRRIPVAEAIRFIRASRSPLVRPELLGLDDVPPAALALAGEDIGEQLFEFLQAGDARKSRGLLLSLYLAGHSAADICDGPLRQAMTRLGELWKHDCAGIYEEHRATDICLQALNQLRMMVPQAADGPVALGGAPAGDPYLIPSLSATIVLASEGFCAVNLGANTPAESLLVAAQRHRPALVWLSVSHVAAVQELAREAGTLARGLAPLGARLAIGGRACRDFPAPSSPHIFIGTSMSELAAYARGLVAAGRGPAPTS